MFRKTLSTVLILVFLLAVWPVTASAAPPDIYIGNETLSMGQTTTSFGGSASYGSDGVLRLNNVNVTTSQNYGSGHCALYASGSLTIELTGSNSFAPAQNSETLNYNYGVYVVGSLTVRGTGGTLIATGRNLTSSGNAFSYGIRCDGEFTLQSGTVNATGGTVNSLAGRSYGMQCDSLALNGGELTATGGQTISTVGVAYSYGLNCTNTAEISDGTLTAIGGNAQGPDTTNSYGILCSAFRQNDGTVSATGGTVESQNSVHSYGMRCSSFTLNNGELNAIGGAATFTSSSVNGFADSYGLYTDSAATLNGGIMTATGGNATTYSAGCIANSAGAMGRSTFIIHPDSTCEATGGTATTNVDSGFTRSYGMTFEKGYTIEGGTCTATAGRANGENAESYGLELEYSSKFQNDGKLQ